MKTMRVPRACLLFLLALAFSCKSGGQSSGAGGGGGGPAGAGGGAAGSSSGDAGSSGAAGGAGTEGGSAGAGANSGTAGMGTVLDAAVEAIPDGPVAIDAADAEVVCGAPRAVTLLPPDVLILMDRSGSMNDDATGSMCQGGCGPTSKWAFVSAAIEQIVSSTASTINWGLKYFADANNSGCAVSTGVMVPIGAPDAATAIATAIAGQTSATGGVNNGSRTPTAVAEKSAAAYLSTIVDGAPKFILLATDGLPNCAVGMTDTSVDDSAGAILAVEAARNAGIPTFVVGIGDLVPVADATLSAMANAGGMARSAAPTYYPVSGTGELVSVLQEIALRSTSCTFSTGALPDGADRNTMTVEGDGTPIPRDTSHANGWDFTEASGTAFRIYGPRCTAITSGTVGALSVRFACL